MLSLYRTLSLRYLSRRWFRALLIVASIMLGVATLVATQALSETMSKATLAAANPMAGTLDFIITNGDFPIDRSLAKEIETVKGVKSVQPRIFDQAKRIVGGEKRPIMVLGIDLTSDKKKPDELAEHFQLKPDLAEVKITYGVVAYAAFQMPAFVGSELNAELEKEELPIPPFLKFLNLDKKVKLVQIEKGQEKHNVFRVASIELKDTADKDKFAAFTGHVVILDLDNAATVVGLPKGKVRRMDVVLEPGADAKKARSAIESLLANRAKVSTMEEHNRSLQSAMDGMKIGFSMCGVAALIVGMFLVYNALSVSVAERRHEIGILLALGATRDQVWRLFAGEAFVLGTVGAALGIPCGMGFAYLGLRPMQDAISDIFSTMNLRQIELTWELVALAFTVGILSAVIASLVPAVQAAYDKPAEAVRRVPKESPVSYLVMHIASTCILVLGGAGLIVIRDYLPRRWGTYGGLSMVMIGALLSAPLFAQLGARAIMPFSRRFFPIEWRIAADNLIRAPGRTGMVIGALAAGVCLIVETAGIIRSNREAIRDWLDTSLAADIIITAGSPVGSGGQNEPMKEGLRDELMKIAGVEEVLPTRQSYNILFRNVNVALTTIVAERADAIERKRLPKHDHLKLYAAMMREKNAIIVSENFAALHHVRIGDYITLHSDKGEVKLHVVGTVVDYTWNLGTIVMNRSDYIEHWQDPSVTLFEVFLKPGVDPKAAKANIAAKLGAQFDLHPLTRSELKDRVDDMIERLYSIALGQEIVVVLVAALGVVTALLISVLQRRREMGLLRAIGASRAQVVYLVLAEACLMGVFGSILGFLFSVPLQWYALQIVFLEESGFTFDVMMPWRESAGIALSALVIATLAGLGPALYAVRERIPDAIAYE
jgi:putative ABC transport system permease protein